MTFNEAKDAATTALNTKLTELINNQKEALKLLLNTKTNNDYLLASTIHPLTSNQETITHMHNTLVKLKKMDTIKIESSKLKKNADGTFQDTKTRTDRDIKTDGTWMNQKKCDDKHMDDIVKAIYNNDKHSFFELLYDITENMSLTDRYTKLLFGSSIKHTTKEKLQA